MNIEVRVQPLNLPTGNELMSGPILTDGVTRIHKEIEHVKNNVSVRLIQLKHDETYQKKKVLFFFIGFASAIIGAVLFLKGLALTDLFSYMKMDIVALVFACVFCIPLIIWFFYLFLPHKRERQLRNQLKVNRLEALKPSAFNDMVNAAKKATEPPVRRIKIIAHFRKKDFYVTASTWQEFCEGFRQQTGLPIEQQLIRYNDEDLEIDLTKKLDADYGLDNLNTVYIFNKGGYMTSNLTKLTKEKQLSAIANLPRPYNTSSVAGNRTSFVSSFNEKRDSISYATVNMNSQRDSISNASQQSITNSTVVSHSKSKTHDTNNSLKSSFKKNDIPGSSSGSRVSWKV
eukprot:gene4394-6215_t